MGNLLGIFRHLFFFIFWNIWEYLRNLLGLYGTWTYWYLLGICGEMMRNVSPNPSNPRQLRVILQSIEARERERTWLRGKVVGEFLVDVRMINPNRCVGWCRVEPPTMQKLDKTCEVQFSTSFFLFFLPWDLLFFSHALAVFRQRFCCLTTQLRWESLGWEILPSNW